MNVLGRKKLGAKIRARRAKAQLAQADCATRSGIQHSRLSRIETGQVGARPDELRRINRAIAARMRELRAIELVLESLRAEDSAAAAP